MVDVVRAELQFFVPQNPNEKPYVYTHPNPSTGERRKNFSLAPQNVEIENIRGKEDSVSLDTTGFSYVRAEAKHKSFLNDEEIKNEYYPESIELLKKLTGASRVVIFDHSMYFQIICRISSTSHVQHP